MDVDPDDVKAMRSENGGRDFRAFMRQQIADGKARRTKPTPVKPPPPPGHRPGAWPTGTRPPDPPPALPPALWDAALHRLRTSTQDRTPCECGTCTPDDDTEENQ
ncbi:hypothetical protein [Streptomyces enissocaesilis]|uniref:Uncharacterized protein n=1 Tax=Streptomyces enissocaesilis TaxID=332589 RepID=A0ABN3WWZ4_9ACTN